MRRASGLRGSGGGGRGGLLRRQAALQRGVHEHGHVVGGRGRVGGAAAQRRLQKPGQLGADFGVARLAQAFARRAQQRPEVRAERGAGREQLVGRKRAHVLGLLAAARERAGLLLLAHVAPDLAHAG